MSCSDDDVDRRCANVEVYMPPPDLEGGVPDSSVGSDPTAMASSSTLEDIPSLIERAIAKLPPDLAAHAVDTKRKARSQDPGWKYGWWPDPSKKDFVQCIFCRKVVPSGICRFKQHLAGGYGDAIKCPNTPAIVRKEIVVYLKKSSRTVLVEVPVEDEDEQDAAGAEEPAAVPVPSSGTKVKQAKKKIAQASSSKSAKKWSLGQEYGPLDMVEKRRKQLPQESLIIRAGGFKCLEDFHFRPSMYLKKKGMMSLIFEAGAMPRLNRLWFRFAVHDTLSAYGAGFDFGISLLSSLKCLWVSINCRGATVWEVEIAKATITNAAVRLPNHPRHEIHTFGEEEMVENEEQEEDSHAAGQRDSATT